LVRLTFLKGREHEMRGRIKFGTDGWRGVIADDFTFDKVRVVAQAIADVVKEDPKAERGILVGYDTRFLSREFAEAVAEVLAGNGFKVYLSEGPVPSPVVSWGVARLNLAGAVMITASHNPPKFNGVKFKASYGGSADKAITDRMQERANNLLERGEEPKSLDLEEAKGKGLVEEVDLREEYLADILSKVDIEAIRGAKIKAVVDPMHGASAGFMDEALRRAGVEVVAIRAERNPGFGGSFPEPIPPHISPLQEKVREVGADVGFATDGDGDRLGVVDEAGTFVNPHRVLALLLMHLYEDLGWRGEVVRTVSTTRMVDLLCERYGLRCHEVPVGFKHICTLMLERDIMVGGEESGGVGFKGHIPERDATLSALFFCEMMAMRGKRPSELLEELWGKVGEHYYRRIDCLFEDEPERRDRIMAELKASPPSEVEGLKVERVDTKDGVKLYLKGGSWLLFRASGTEPLIRVYAEAREKELVDRVIEWGAKRVGGEWMISSW